MSQSQSSTLYRRPFSQSRSTKRVKTTKVPRSIPLNPRTYTTKTSSRTEVKYKTFAPGAYGAATTGIVQHYGGLNIGYGPAQRVGMAVNHLFQTVKLRLDRSPGVSDFTARVIFGIWKQGDGSYNSLPDGPGADDILDNMGGAITYMQAPLNPGNSRAYTILSDEIFNMPAAAGAGSPVAPLGETRIVTRKFKNQRVQAYNDGNDADMVDWYYFCMTFCATGSTGYIEIVPQVAYTDN